MILMERVHTESIALECPAIESGIIIYNKPLSLNINSQSLAELTVTRETCSSLAGSNSGGVHSQSSPCVAYFQFASLSTYLCWINGLAFRTLLNHDLYYCPKCERDNLFAKVCDAPGPVPMDFHYLVRI